MSFDPRLFVVMSGLMCLLMSAVLFAMRRSYPSSVGGLGEWTAAPLAWFVAAMLFVARGTVSDFLSIVAANGMLLAGSLLFYMGSRRHVGARSQWRAWSGLIAAGAAAIAWFTYVFPCYGARLGSMALVMTTLVSAHIALLLRQDRRGFAVRFMLAVLGLQILVWSFRLLSMLLGYTGDTLLGPSLAQTIFVGSSIISIPLLTVGCVLMASDKLHIELEYMNMHDSLTKALTRRVIMQSCEEGIERCRRHGHPLSLMMIDLDHFKAVNDTHGHPHGDAILADFATRTGALLRRPDRLGRYGGEEFLLLLPDTDRAAALNVAQRIHAAGARDDRLSWRVSIGLTGWTGTDDTLQAMLTRADAALYRAKNGGRNQTQAA